MSEKNVKIAGPAPVTYSGYLSITCFGVLPWLWYIDGVPNSVLNLAWAAYYALLIVFEIIAVLGFVRLTETYTPEQARNVLTEFPSEPQSLRWLRLLAIASLVAAGSFFGAFVIVLGLIVIGALKQTLRKAESRTADGGFPGGAGTTGT